SLDRRVVGDDPDAVARQVNVQLEHLRGVLAHRLLESGDRILRSERSAPAMRDVQGRDEPAKERVSHWTSHLPARNHLPVNLGGRFSLYARIPSAASSLVKSRCCSSRSRAIPSWKPTSMPDSTARLM